VAAGADYRTSNRLAAGQAAWIDRPISSQEPNELLLLLEPKDFSITWTEDQVMGIAADLSYLTTLRDPNKYQVFQVMNDGKGQFKVISIPR
jgi:hypothetical protein